VVPKEAGEATKESDCRYRGVEAAVSQKQGYYTKKKKTDKVKDEKMVNDSGCENVGVTEY
jgi:hypothetical protein